MNNKACVRVRNIFSAWLPIQVGVQQGYERLSWLFKVSTDGVVREVNTRMLGKGLSLVNANGREWNLTQLLFADDTALVADSEGRLRQLAEEFGNEFKRRKLSE